MWLSTLQRPLNFITPQPRKYSDMDKEYISPFLNTVEVRWEGLLAGSGSGDSPASGYGKSELEDLD